MRTLAAPVANLVLPADCRVCGEQLRRFDRVPVCDACLTIPQLVQPDYVCSRCQATFLSPKVLDEHQLCRVCRTGGFAFHSANFYSYFGGPLRELIHLLKYEGVTSLAHPLANLLYEAWPKHTRLDGIVPMPLHWERQIQRGYNQSELLARPLADRLQVPLVRALRREKATQALADLGAKERRREIAGAFVLHPRLPTTNGQPPLAGQHLLLIDDVLTTGSTASAAAKVLRNGGASVVYLLTLARVDRRPQASSMHAKGPKLLTKSASPGAF